jgi:predicted glycoside hydrolase/deacetylase ChbG (UPF0249 family)
MRYLIVNADDFGLSESVNRGIIEAAERGIVTSTSLMVRQPAAAAAGAYARSGARISVGLHVDLGEWVFRNQEWVPLYSVVATEDPEAAAAEIRHQLSEFQRLVSRDPSHLDSHQHVHRKDPVRSIMVEHARALGVPLRQCTPGIGYYGDFYGQTGEGEPLPDLLTVENLKGIAARLPEGITELGCHPGYGEGLATCYREERAAELKVLCTPGLREALAGMAIRLCSFDNRPDRGSGSEPST